MHPDAKLLSVGLTALAAAACAAASVALATVASAAPVKLRVTPARSVEDQPIDIRLSGLTPRERVTLTLRSTDAKGVRWSSDAVYVADAHGVVDTRRSPSREGSYDGAWPMGLIASMTPTAPGRRGSVPEYFWPGATRAEAFSLSATAGGRPIASARFRRAWGNVPQVEKDETVRSAGFVGSFFAPRGALRRAAVLVFGGSEGGLSTWLLASRFAADGYPALALAYFDAPGLPQKLEDIPLEYFRHALQWLDRQPQVDPQRAAVLGISRGSEAALLLGVHYPALVHGVLALVPSSVVNCGIEGAGKRSGCIGPAWTLGERPIPYTREFGTTHPTRPTDVPAAVIPVERIRAPLLLACGGADSVWDSCAFSRAIVARLERKHAGIRHGLYVYPVAGHGVGALLPDEPGRLALDYLLDFGVPADEQAREQLWPHVLAFLKSIGR